MIIHVTEQGETIWSIANEYGVSTERIIADNGLFGLNNLVPGQALIILQPDEVYVVKPNDTIFSISQEFGITPDNLKQKNPSLAQSGTITPGEVLAISFIDEGNSPINIYGFLYPSIKDNVLKSTLPSLGSGAVFSYGVKEDGTLIEIDDASVINRITRGNASPVMVLTSITETGNFDSAIASMLFNNKEIQTVAIENIIRTMNQKGYKGLDIDFEFVNAEDADAFVSFVERVTKVTHVTGQLSCVTYYI